MRLATGLSGGLRTGEVCGAVAGACLVLGLRHGQGEATDTAAKLKTYEQVREFQRRFQARHGFTRCKDLLGCDVGTEEGLKQARERDLFHTLCPKLVEDAAAILDEML
jgi:C_GCAxxG_C_C family probable redox protein